MGGKILRLIALSLVLGAALCVGVMFVGGLGIMSEMWQGGDMEFNAVAVRIGELREWGLTGIGLFLLALFLLWMTPDHRDKNRFDEGAVPIGSRTNGCS